MALMVDPWITKENVRRFREQLTKERNPGRRSVLENLLLQQEAELPADNPDRIRQWRMKAEELRTAADQVTEFAARDSLRRVARTYDKLANDAEARLGGGQSAPAKDAG